MNKPSSMQVDRTITLGNLVSWGLIFLAFSMGYARLGSATAQNIKDIAYAKSVATRAEDKANSVGNEQAKAINQLTTDIAVIKSTLITMEKRLDEIKNQRK